MRVVENWRVSLLVVAVLASGVLLFGPVGAGSGDAANGTEATAAGPTNLKYGLELAGGTRIRAPLVGVTAENVSVSRDNRSTARTTIAEELGVSESVIRIHPRQNDVEVLTKNVTQQEVAAGLQSAGYDVSESNIRDGVTKQTREKTEQVLDSKINQGGLAGGSADIATAATGDKFIVVEVPNANREEVLALIGDRGRVEIQVRYPAETDNGTEYRNTTVLSNQQLQRAQVGQPRVSDGVPGVPVTLTDRDGEQYAQEIRDVDWTEQEARAGCRFEENPQSSGYCLMTLVDGELQRAYGMRPRLSRLINNGEWEDSPTFTLTTTSLEQARQVQVNLQAGALPTKLDVDSGTTYFLQPSLADRFKSLALITGLVAWFAVAGAVFVRYRSPRVAIPMILTAAAEVWLLLGFASVIGLALDLSHIAGFIAVIGTGVDDLVIIADEIIQEEGVATGRVFQNRFRKAFWVIGAAAATTIIAMSPLAVLSLGDLQGFAIVTIVGVILGIGVTRPAYGDILRALMVED
jgi:preprotein translocase subunit SecD